MGPREWHLGFWLGAMALLVAGIAVFRDILLPFISGMVLAYFLNPLADRLEKQGMSRIAAASSIVGLVVLALVLALVFLLPILAVQLKNLAVGMPAEIERLKLALEAAARDRLGAHYPQAQAAIEKAIADMQSGWAGSAAAMASALWSGGLAVVNVLSLILITPIVVFYLLVDWHAMLERIDHWLPRDHAATIRTLAGEIDTSVAAFIRGQGAICLLLGALYAAGLSAVGLRYGLVVGLATGVLGFVPIVGWVLGTLIALGLAVVQFGLSAGALVAVLMVMGAGLALDTAVLSPRFVGQKVGLHPVWLIFALFAFSYLLGFVGTLIAVPLAAALGVLVRHALKLYLESDIYGGKPAAGGDVKRSTKVKS
jgi:predicted PurR-regulated permease PerM